MSNDSHRILWEQYAQEANFERLQGNLARAWKILRIAFREAEEYSELPQVIMATADLLAEDFLRQQKFGEAESLYRLSLELTEKLLGTNHESVAACMRKVSLVQILAFRVEALGNQASKTPPPLRRITRIANAS
jgi:hypothetical protein